MRRKRVQSSAVRSVGHDARREILEIEFTGGTVYRYDDFLQPLHQEFVQADSKRRFFRGQILDRYAVARV